MLLLIFIARFLFIMLFFYFLIIFIAFFEPLHHQFFGLGPERERQVLQTDLVDDNVLSSTIWYNLITKQTDFTNLKVELPELSDIYSYTYRNR